MKYFLSKLFAVTVAFHIVTFHAKAQCTIFSEPFTTTLGSFTPANGSSGNWIFTNSCAASNLSGHTTTGSALFSGTSCQYGNAISTVSGNLNSPTINIPATGTKTLAFNYFLLNECGTGTCAQDVLSVMISSNGGTTYTTIMNSNVGGLLMAGAAWTPVTYNLSTYSGQNIIIRFNFNSIDGLANNFDGVYIDDVTITTNGSPAQPAAVGGPSTICGGLSASYSTSTVSGASYSWSVPAGAIINSGQGSTAVNVTFGNISGNVGVASVNACGTSAVSTLSVTVSPAISNAGTNDTICFGGSVQLDGSGGITYTWSPSSGLNNSNISNPVASPTAITNYTLTTTNADGCTAKDAVLIIVNPNPTVTASADTTICLGDSAQLSATGLLTSTSGILITECDLGAPDRIEIQNMSSSIVSTAGWVVAISESPYTNINSVNPVLWNLPASMAPGQIFFKNDLAGDPNYWGSNMFWNPGAYPSFTGWAIILDNTGAIMDFIVWAWPSANIQAMNPTINGFSVMIGSQWAGDGVDATSAGTGMSINRQGSSDNNILSDYAVLTSNINTQNPGLSYPFSGGSVNSYSWSPSNGLSNPSVSNPNASPAFTTTYTVSASDANGCTGTNVVTVTVITCPVGITETMDNEDIIITPNPGSGVFTLTTSDGSKGKIGIEIMSLQGKIIYSSQLSAVNGPSTNIDLSSQPVGMYFLKVISDDKTAIKKIIKQ